MTTLDLNRTPSRWAYTLKEYAEYLNEVDFKKYRKNMLNKDTIKAFVKEDLDNGVISQDEFDWLADQIDNLEDPR